MKRNVSELKAKMNNHVAIKCEAIPNTWTVVSGTSGSEYMVRMTEPGVYRCGCMTDRYTKKGESCGCSHVASVVKAVAAEENRRLTLHDGAEAAKRQHRAVIEIGSGLFATTRPVGA